MWLECCLLVKNIDISITLSIKWDNIKHNRRRCETDSLRMMVSGMMTATVMMWFMKMLTFLLILSCSNFLLMWWCALYYFVVVHNKIHKKNENCHSHSWNALSCRSRLITNQDFLEGFSLLIISFWASRTQLTAELYTTIHHRLRSQVRYNNVTLCWCDISCRCWWS